MRWTVVGVSLGYCGLSLSIIGHYPSSVARENILLILKGDVSVSPVAWSNSVLNERGTVAAFPLCATSLQLFCWSSPPWSRIGRFSGIERLPGCCQATDAPQSIQANPYRLTCPRASQCFACQAVALPWLKVLLLMNGSFTSL